MNIVTEYLTNTNKLAICIFPSDTCSHDKLINKMKDYTLFYALRFKSIIDKIDIVFADSIDHALNLFTQYDHILFMAAGVRIYDSSILIDINNVINDNPNYMAAGHILEWGNDWYELHHQFVLVNVKNWQAAGKPVYGGWKPDVDLLPIIERSKENFHDDYTPLWIKATGGHMWVYHEKQGWNFIGEALMNGFEIVNWSKQIRDKRTYYYPETNSELFYQCLTNRAHHKDITNSNQRKLINEAIGVANQVWVLNSEDMNVMSNGEQYDLVALPASGFKYLDVFKSGALTANGKIVIYDFNQDSLDWIETIYTSTSTDFRSIVESFPKHSELKWYGIRNPPILTTDGLLCKEFLRDFQLTIDYFGGRDLFLKYLQQFRNADVTFIKTDLLFDNANLVDAIGTGKSMLHISNIFATDFINARLGLGEMSVLYNDFRLSLNNNTRVIGLTPYNEFCS